MTMEDYASGCTAAIRFKLLLYGSLLLSGLLWTEQEWLWFLAVRQLTLQQLEVSQSWAQGMFSPWASPTVVQAEWQLTAVDMPRFGLLMHIIRKKLPSNFSITIFIFTTGSQGFIFVLLYRILTYFKISRGAVEYWTVQYHRVGPCNGQLVQLA